MVTRCKFPTAQGRELRALRTLKARGQIGLHFRFREGCTVAPLHFSALAIEMPLLLAYGGMRFAPGAPPIKTPAAVLPGLS